MLGYVDTNYTARTLAAVEADIDKFYSWYNVDGIFFDQGYSADCNQVAYYQALNTYVKAKGGKGVTIVNYGVNPPSCYINASDILITFEGTMTSYLTWAPSAWEAGFPANRFYNIVYATAQTDVAKAVTLGKSRNVGYVYVTDDNLPNPYDNLPATAYWNIELQALS